MLILNRLKYRAHKYQLREVSTVMHTLRYNPTKCILKVLLFYVHSTYRHNIIYEKLRKLYVVP